MNLIRFFQRVLLTLVYVVYCTFTFTVIFLLSVSGARAVVFLTEYFAGEPINIGTGLEAFLIIAVLVVLTQYYAKKIKSRSKRTEFMKWATKFLALHMIDSTLQWMSLIASLAAIFVSYKYFHQEYPASCNESYLTRGPIFFWNLLGGVNKFSTSFMIAYAVVVFLCCGDTRFTLIQCCRAVRNKRNKRKHWRSKACFGGLMVLGLVKIVLFGILMYYVSFGMHRILPPHLRLSWLFTCLVAILVGFSFAGVHSCWTTPYKLLQSPWFICENYLKSQYTLLTYLLYPSVALVFYRKNISIRDKAEDDKGFLEFGAVLCVAIIQQAKLLTLEAFLRVEIVRANQVYDVRSSSPNRGRRNGRGIRQTYSDRARFGSAGEERVAANNTNSLNRSRGNEAQSAEIGRPPTYMRFIPMTYIDAHNNNIITNI